MQDKNIFVTINIKQIEWNKVLLQIVELLYNYSYHSQLGQIIIHGKLVADLTIIVSNIFFLRMRIQLNEQIRYLMAILTKPCYWSQRIQKYWYQYFYSWWNNFLRICSSTKPCINCEFLCLKNFREIIFSNVEHVSASSCWVITFTTQIWCPKIEQKIKSDTTAFQISKLLRKFLFI